jgi:hypothetical protein
MYCNSSRGVCFFFDIDVKGGESVVISRMLQWYSWMFFKGFPSMPKGEIVGMFITGRQKVEYLFFIDGKLSQTMMNKRKWQDQQRNDVLQWYSWMFFKGLPSMPKGEIVGIFITGRQKAKYLFFIDGKLNPTMMNKRKWED